MSTKANVGAQQSQRKDRPRFGGQIVVNHPPSQFAFVALAACSVLIVATFLFFGQYSRKVSLSGVLVPSRGAIRVTSPVAGVVTYLDANERSMVAAGQKIAVISVDRRDPSSEMSIEGAAESQVFKRQKLVERQRVAARELAASDQRRLHERRRFLDEEVGRIDEEIQVQRRRIQNAEEAVASYTRLQEGGFLSKAGLQPKEDALLDQRARLQSLERTRLELLRDRDGIQHEFDATPIKTALSEFANDKEQASIEQEATELRGKQALSIQAPLAGMLTLKLAAPGEYVAAGQAITTLIPGGSILKAHLYAPSRDVGLLVVGQKVNLRYRALPPAKFGYQRGTIEEISMSAADPKDLPATSSGKEPLFRIVVSVPSDALGPPERRAPLSAGFQVDADAIVETRTLLQWLIAPLYDARVRID